MRIIFFTVLLFFYNSVKSQEDTLIKHALSDRSNFEIMAWLSNKHQMPKKFYIFDTTLSWNANRFYLPGFGVGPDKKPGDEHHAYYHSYLFRDSTLNMLFPIEEKIKLFEKSGTSKHEKIRIKTSIAQTIPSYENVRSGFILWVSSPIYSTDNNYAFIDFTILEKGKSEISLNEAYHSTVCVVYKKENNKWRKLKIVNHLIL